MKRLTGLALAAVGFVLFSVAPALAQIPPVPPLPLPPIPAPPPEAAPVFELVAPTAYPTCGTALLALFVARTTEPSLASPIIQGSEPLLVICGAVPPPPVALRCDQDVQAQAVFDQVQGDALGAPTGIVLNPEGQVVEQIVVLEDKLPPPANTAGLGDRAVATLLCQPIGVPPRTTGGSSSPPPDYSAPPFTPPAPFVPISAPPLGGPPGAQTQPVGTQALPQAQTVGRPVLYGAIWVLPLALLIFASYAGGALTREIELPASPGS